MGQWETQNTCTHSCWLNHLSFELFRISNISFDFLKNQFNFYFSWKMFTRQTISANPKSGSKILNWCQEFVCERISSRMFMKYVHCSYEIHFSILIALFIIVISQFGWMFYIVIADNLTGFDVWRCQHPTVMQTRTRALNTSFVANYM